MCIHLGNRFLPTMLLTSFAFRINRPPQRLVHVLVMLKEEYDRALLAESCYYRLKGRNLAGLRQQHADSGGIPRSIFESFYRQSTAP